jgi:hypothetical protein
MTFLERYIAGDTELVHEEIRNLGSKAFTVEFKSDVDKVLSETFRRVAYNLEIIYNELLKIGYQFKTEFAYNFEKPLHQPLENTESLLLEIDKAVSPFGYVPLSLKYFYKIVGAVNFAWDYETNEDLIWELADPIQIASIDSVAIEVTDKYWLEDIQQYVDDEDFGCAFINLSADYLHKDNISGGQQYAIEIPKTRSVDSKFMNEPNNTTFINYLRICFERSGFPGIKMAESMKGFKEFSDEVKSKMKKI